MSNISEDAATKAYYAWVFTIFAHGVGVSEVVEHWAKRSNLESYKMVESITKGTRN